MSSTTKLFIFLFYKIFSFGLFIFITGFISFHTCIETHSEPAHLIELRKEITKQIKKNQGIIGVTYIDIATGEYLSMNGDTPFNPASVIKLPVMVEAFRQRELGLINFSDTLVLKGSDKMWGSGKLYYARIGKRYAIRELIEVMITDSDNTATKMLIGLLGNQNITNTMRELGLNKTVVGTSMLLDAEGLNYTTPNDMAVLLYNLYQLKVVSPQASLEMIDILLRQHHKWGIPRFLPENLRIANKTGSLTGVRNDAAIIFYENRPYILSILTNNMPANDYTKLLVSKISQNIFEWKCSHTYDKNFAFSNSKS